VSFILFRNEFDHAIIRRFFIIEIKKARLFTIFLNLLQIFCRLAKLIRNTKSYFVISKGQRNAMLLLFALLLAMIIVYFMLPHYLKMDYSHDGTLKEEARRFEATRVHEEKHKKRELTPFAFDPNETTADGFQQLGLSERQADMIIRYRNAGGKFRTPEDFGKIYSISEEEYNILQPYIMIKEEVLPAKETTKVVEKRTITPFPFDPNRIDSAEMTRMGLRESQIKNIINYRNAGGTFRIKKDIEKLYTISTEDYSKLEKYILLPSVDSLSPEEKMTATEPLIIEINSADTAAMQQLRGIGPAFANRIVSYRDRLGGFFDKSQLLEVFGMDTTRYFQIAEHIEVDRNSIRKMNLNTAGFREMVGHPYLEHYIVTSIFDYKDAKGGFDSIQELTQINLIYEQLYQKLEHYFTVDEKINDSIN
jgi:competence protein ComEA